MHLLRKVTTPGAVAGLRDETANRVRLEAQAPGMSPPAVDMLVSKAQEDFNAALTRAMNEGGKLANLVPTPTADTVLRLHREAEAHR